MGRLKNAALVFCLFIVLVVIFSSCFRASQVGTFFGALAGTPLLVHIFNRLAPRNITPARRKDINRRTDEALAYELEDAHD
jgi:hypothetical protein